ncbi:TIGR03364 family FAD-dependent oxidoreductase [Arthrobacter sp. MYb227]|uniref:TIGR03364 family FAD-dependent oxidoreductase n=1 Tax=Arthrobacter sp. MYb227 TaxID=1848601 RepID=UPI000CFBC1F3|nr:TIGR03364 family FAD-dependent oxidoreductase [Arthrobacter sp. MYb227]PQZ91579.1 TIGR03364 family FAD-dependent oxidoreductase [Arthrobacter sp. MYb227]
MNNTKIDSKPTEEVLASTDVLVVGAGIIGLAHAAIAHQAGFSVTVIERDHRAIGASIRNFGHACITAQHGELYDLAQAGRRHWLDFASKAGFWALEAGALVVAATELELQLLREFSASRPVGQVRVLDAEEVRAKLGRENTDGIRGGAFLADDLRVDPRTTVGTLASWLDRQENAEVHFNTAAVDFTFGTTRRARVKTSRGIYETDHVFICVGHDVDYLFPEVALEHKITRCSLQMAAAAAPESTTIIPAVLTATSMLRYDAFTRMPSAPRLRIHMESQRPDLLDIGANVMFTQRPDGTMLLGDSHSYELTQPPFLSESTTDTLLDAAAKVLDVERFTLTERWQGIYASSDVAPLLVKEISESVTLVSVTSGIGMTVSFGLAEANLNAMLPAGASRRSTSQVS